VDSISQRFEERTKLLHENQEKNSLLERDVLRFREREKHLEKIRMLKAKRPWLVFEVQREDAVVKKKTFQMAVQALEDYRSKEAPIQDQIRCVMKYLLQTLPTTFSSPCHCFFPLPKEFMKRPSLRLTNKLENCESS
jgi:hypothetical protein